ncbi:hypothetical protein KK083_28235 [Fulvivirgaceae bacterium PWU4]|uniref:Uncharacterized protein n=1 Tax=Chryseosolibacter histidini TaxID=2782349 RepID=A0AAP2DT35_9BACT|nr:hypothetical protein [Chryseosolibacter histidini]MBT1700813.1 hypothetical protein [Chryseosolibacter histidini]
MTKKLTSLNLIFGIVYFGTFPHWYSDLSGQIHGIGCLLTIWYNWAASKRMMGQTTDLKVVNLIVGSLIMLYGVLLITDGIYKVWGARTIGELAKALIFLASTEILFGTTILLQTVRTMRLFTGKKTVADSANQPYF